MIRKQKNKKTYGLGSIQPRAHHCYCCLPVVVVGCDVAAWQRYGSVVIGHVIVVFLLLLLSWWWGAAFQSLVWLY
jgi:hypothetical protein